MAGRPRRRHSDRGLQVREVHMTKAITQRLALCGLLFAAAALSQRRGREQQSAQRQALSDGFCHVNLSYLETPVGMAAPRGGLPFLLNRFSNNNIFQCCGAVKRPEPAPQSRWKATLSIAIGVPDLKRARSTT